MAENKKKAVKDDSGTFHKRYIFHDIIHGLVGLTKYLQVFKQLITYLNLDYSWLGRILDLKIPTSKCMKSFASNT